MGIKGSLGGFAQQEKETHVEHAPNWALRIAEKLHVSFNYEMLQRVPRPSLERKGLLTQELYSTAPAKTDGADSKAVCSATGRIDIPLNFFFLARQPQTVGGTPLVVIKRNLRLTTTSHNGRLN